MSRIAKAYRKHARKRMRERYGEATISDLTGAIKSGQYKSITRLTDSRSLCVAKIKDGAVWFIMNRKKKCPITVLSPDYYRVQEAFKDSTKSIPKWARDGEERQTLDTTTDLE